MGEVLWGWCSTRSDLLTSIARRWTVLASPQRLVLIARRAFYIRDPDDRCSSPEDCYTPVR